MASNLYNKGGYHHGYYYGSGGTTATFTSGTWKDMIRKPKPEEEIIFVSIDEELLKLREYLLKCENK